MKLLLSLNAERAATAVRVGRCLPIHLVFNFHGVRARLDTNSTYLAHHLRVGYGFFETNEDERSECTLLALEAGARDFDDSSAALVPKRLIGDHLLSAADLRLLFLLKTKELLAYYTTIALFGQIVARLSSRFACLHAATVAFDGHALLLPGAARCGKTVLTSLLLQEGLAYTSDDVTLVGRQSLRVAPFPRAVNIRDEYVAEISPLLKQARRVLPFAVADQKRLLVDLAVPVPSTVTPAVVCFPRFRQHQSMKLRALPPAEALVRLLGQRFCPMGCSPEDTITEDFEDLARLVDCVESYELLYADPVAASALLGQLLTGMYVRQ